MGDGDEIPRARRVLSGVMLGVFFLAGCGLTSNQKVAVDTFAISTRDLAVAAKTEFQRSRQDVIEMNRVRLELGDTGVQVNALDHPLKLSDTRDRIVALTALQEYAELLRRLVGTTSKAELVEAGNSFVGNLRSIKGVNVSDQQAEGIGKAVAAVGGIYVEKRRADAIRDIVGISHDPVLSVIELVRKDFDPNSDYWNAGYRKVALDLEGHAASLNPKDLPSRQSVRRADMMASENQARFKAVSAQMMRLASSLADAQKNLRLVLSSSEPATQEIDYLAVQIREFKTIYSLLRNESAH